MKLTRKEREMKQRRQDIINAAKELFLTKDFDAVSMQEIAQKAEFTRRTLYSYFKSKLDLITVIIIVSLSELDEILSAEIDNTDSSYQKLCNYGKHQYLFYKNNPSYFKLIHYFDLAIHSSDNKLSPEVISQLEHSPTHLDDMMLDILKTGVADATFRADLNVELAKDYFSKAWYGIIHQYILHPQHPEECIYLELEYLIGGLMRK